MDSPPTNIFLKILVRFATVLLLLFIPALIVNAVDVVKEEIDDITKLSKASELVYEKFLTWPLMPDHNDFLKS